MTESIKKKDLSPLVKSALALDQHFASLDRLSTRIEEISLKSEFDIAQARRLMGIFAESATAASQEIMQFSELLSEGKARSENAARLVATKAEELGSLQSERDIKLAAFQGLTAKVNAINQEVKELRRPSGEVLSAEERATLTQRLADVNAQLHPLIEEARILKNEARKSQMKTLEQNADALGQSLTAVTQKLASYIQAGPITQ